METEVCRFDDFDLCKTIGRYYKGALPQDEGKEQ